VHSSPPPRLVAPGSAIGSSEVGGGEGVQGGGGKGWRGPHFRIGVSDSRPPLLRLEWEQFADFIVLAHFRSDILIDFLCKQVRIRCVYFNVS